MSNADRPKTKDELFYHTHTKPGSLSSLCLIVGAPGRADDIAKQFFTNSKRFANSRRGIVSHTGWYETYVLGTKEPTRCFLSVTTSGMGGASTGIILPEVVRSGARVLIRVGSCGSLVAASKVGDPIIVTGAIRRDGASENWAPPEFPAMADWKVVDAMIEAAQRNTGGTGVRYHYGIECTTSDFNLGQGRPGMFGEVTPEAKARHEQVVRLGAVCYSMEAASLFVWCATEGGGLPCGAINAVFANRHTGEWGVEGEMLAAKIALDTLVILSEKYGSGLYPKPSYK